MDITGVGINWSCRDKIPEARKVFTERMDNLENKLLVYAEDVEKTMTNDYWVETFLEWHRGNVVKAVDGLLYSLKYQKRYRLRELQDSDFPSEYYSHGSFFEYEPDKLGRRTLYVRMKYIPACKETRDISLQWVFFQHFKMQEKSGEQGYICVFDNRDISMKNIDVAATSRIMEVAEVFPFALRLSVNLNLPLAMKLIFQGGLYILPSDRRNAVFIKEGELHEVIPTEKIPDFLNGKCQKPYSGQEVVPQGCLTPKDFFLGAAFSRNSEEGSEDENKNRVSKAVIEKMKKSPLMWSNNFDVKTARSVLSYYKTIMPQAVID